MIMTSVLYITAHPLDESESTSMATGKLFIDTYQKVNPTHDIIHLNLYKSFIPSLDEDIFSGWNKLETGMVLEQLSENERKKISSLNELVDQFIQSDKYVFVNPMWNFLYPPIMKAYIDAITVAGKTFKYTRNGPVGLLQDKKAFHIQASGWIYSNGPFVEDEASHRHLKSIMSFVGVTDFQGLFIEGHDQYCDRADIIKEEGKRRARDLAESF